jgi:hypothetical protein
MLHSITMISNNQQLLAHVHIVGIQPPPIRVQEQLMFKISLLMMRLFQDVLTGKFLIKTFSTILTEHSLD